MTLIPPRQEATACRGQHGFAVLDGGAAVGGGGTSIPSCEPYVLCWEVA